MIGPIVAQTEAQAHALVMSILAATSGPVRIDVPGEQVAFREWLSTLGLREEKKRPEMSLGETRLSWRVPQRFALAAQAWG